MWRRTSGQLSAMRDTTKGRTSEIMMAGDFVKTHEGDFWGNVVECVSGDVKVRGFCTSARRLVLKRLNPTCVVKQDHMRWWKSASTTIRSTALARIWEPQPNSTAKGGWLEDSTVDAVIRWSLYGDTKAGVLAPSPTRTGYIPCTTFQDLRQFLKDKRQTAKMAESPVLQMASEGLTGLHGCQWREVESSQPIKGIELMIPALQHALMESSTLQAEEWHGMNVSGLQSHHYVRAGSRILVPRRQRSHRLVKWLKTYGWCMDLTSMDHLFAGQTEGLKVGCGMGGRWDGCMGGRRNGWMSGWVDGWGVRLKPKVL
jgi:hypothetical protein